MMLAIREICSWGQGKFDGWIIPKAVYRRYSVENTVRFQTGLLAGRQRYAQIQTVGYTAAGAESQRLKVILMSAPPRAWGTIPESTEHPGETVCSPCVDGDCPENTDGMHFSTKGMNRFLSESGDTNPLHQGEPALVPGLWILDTLYGRYARTRCPVELNIRFMHPLYTGQQIILHGNQDTVTGMRGSCNYFHMTIQSFNTGGYHED